MVVILTYYYYKEEDYKSTVQQEEEMKVLEDSLASAGMSRIILLSNEVTRVNIY